jgi:hypothetical protein
MFGATAISGPGPNPGPVDYIGTAVFGIVLGLGFLRGTRMRVELDDEGVTVFNYFSTRRVDRGALVDASADYGGLRLICADASVVTAATLGKPNWATWLHRRTQADERVDVVRRWIAGRRNQN